jgi:uroporphyrinogen-III synthase
MKNVSKPKYGLRGKIIAITRNEKTNQEFINLIRSSGGVPISLPTIVQIPCTMDTFIRFFDRIMERSYDYYVFLSGNAVEILIEFAKRINKFDKIVGELNSRKIAVIGQSTGRILNSYGIHVDIVPDNFSSIGLLKKLMTLNIPQGTRFLFPRSSTSPLLIKDNLEKSGFKVDEFLLYSSVGSKLTKEWVEFSNLLKKRLVSSIIFTSPSSVKSFCNIMAGLLPDFVLICNKIALVSIGPITTNELFSRELYSFESSEHTIKGTFEAVKNILAND